MKKIILVTLFTLLSFQNVSNAEDSKTNESKQEIIKNNNKLENFTGEYNLLNYKVKIRLDKNNKLILTIPNMDESVEKLNKIFLEISPDKFKEKGTGIFPIHGDFELIPVSDTIFIIKFSLGDSIEFKKNNSKISNDLIFRNSNFETINKEDLIQIFEEYKKLLDVYEKSYSELEKAKSRAKSSSTISNMHTTQTITETYSVDFAGVYPDSIENLYKEASKGNNSYWKVFKNTYTSKTGLGKDGAIMDYKQYLNYKPSPSLKGLVLFESLKCKYNKEEKRNDCESYKIYGTDENGEIIVKDGKIFYLDNN